MGGTGRGALSTPLTAARRQTLRGATAGPHPHKSAALGCGGRTPYIILSLQDRNADHPARPDRKAGNGAGRGTSRAFPRLTRNFSRNAMHPSDEPAEHHLRTRCVGEGTRLAANV